MDGLIPLILNTERQQDHHQPHQQQQQQYNKRYSQDPRSVQARRRIRFSLPLSICTPQSNSRRQSMPPIQAASSRNSLLAPPPSRMPIPATASEWRKAIDEVKRKYAARKYRSCSMLCCELLEDLAANSPDTQPLYLIYLHFYAASSFEWCAWSLSSCSSYRTKLLCDAQTHYMKTESLLVALECTMPESPSPMRSSFVSSPGLSVTSSQAWSTCSAASSPRTSIFSLDEEKPPAPPTAPPPPPPPPTSKPPKRVSFFNLPDLVEAESENDPYERPDSPTLGLGTVRLSPVPKSSKRRTAPSVLKHHVPFSSSSEQEKEKPRAKSCLLIKTPANDIVHENVIIHHPDPTTEPEPSPTGSDAFNIETFLHERNLSRSRAQLAELRSQVRRHRAAVDELLLAAADADAAESSSSTITEEKQNTWTAASPVVVTTMEEEEVGKEEVSRRPTLRLDTDVLPSVVAVPKHARTPSGGSVEEGGTPTTPGGRKDESLQERIERLRASGWRRKRFDSRRYENLREQVLDELKGRS